MSRHAQELAKAHAQAVALRDALKASVREANRILARVERAMRTAVPASEATTSTSTKPKEDDERIAAGVAERGRQ